MAGRMPLGGSLYIARGVFYKKRKKEKKWPLLHSLWLFLRNGSSCPTPIPPSPLTQLILALIFFIYMNILRGNVIFKVVEFFGEFFFRRTTIPQSFIQAACHSLAMVDI